MKDDWEKSGGVTPYVPGPKPINDVLSDIGIFYGLWRFATNGGRVARSSAKNDPRSRGSLSKR